MKVVVVVDLNVSPPLSIVRSLARRSSSPSRQSSYRSSSTSIRTTRVSTDTSTSHSPGRPLTPQREHLAGNALPILLVLLLLTFKVTRTQSIEDHILISALRQCWTVSSCQTPPIVIDYNYSSTFMGNFSRDKYLQFILLIMILIKSNKNITYINKK